MTGTRSAYTFKGQILASEKKYNSGSGNRSKSAAQTLAEVRPLFERTGITRLADITGLDRISLPVTLAIRPNSRTLSVSSGKGLDLDSALISGAMEALELYHAEYATLPTFIMTYEEISNNCASIPRELLPRRKGSLFNVKWPETWTLGWDILNGEEVAIPIQLASMAPQIYAGNLPTIASFVTDSNGLASGNNITEAIMSGLYEVIERDAIALHKCASEKKGRLVNSIDINTIPYPRIHETYSRIRSANCELLIYDCTSDLGIPTYKAVLLDNLGGCTSVVEGFGSNLSHETALIRAITEACQGRAVVISGARDDIFNFSLDKLRGMNFSIDFKTVMSEVPTKFVLPNDFQESVDLSVDLDFIIKKLRNSGINQVIVVELDIFDCDQSFAKIIVPGLEGYPSHGYVPGKRAGVLLSSLSAGEQVTSCSFPTMHLPAGGMPL